MCASVPCSEVYTEVKQGDNIREIVHLENEDEKVVSKHSEEFTDFCAYCNEKQQFD